MDNTIDYSSYSLEELLDARQNIDADAFPERAEQLDKLIATKKVQQVAARSDSQQIVRQGPVTFHGNGKEYFSIWIVNLLLTIVTLGIYSAWAKVRTNRYFYSNTEIDGHRFSYLAEPLQILKGRIIGVVLFGGYFLASSISPIIGLVALLLLFAATPFLICQSLKFRMKMTGYRNIRFGFTGQYGKALLAFIVYPFLTLFTLYLAMPWALKKMDEFIVNNTTFGNKEFKSHLSTGQYFKAGLGAGFIGIAIFILGFLGLGLDMGTLAQQDEQAPFNWSMLGFFAIYLAVFVVSSSFYTAIIRNHIFANSQIEDVAQFNSNATFTSLLALKTTNFLALICTLGFAMPWVKVRTAKYYADATRVDVLAGADEVIVDPEQSASAVGEEVADVFDVDVALG